MLTERQNRGVKEFLIACVDGLKGFPDAINTTGAPYILESYCGGSKQVCMRGLPIEQASKQARALWVKSLNTMLARKPEIVVASHQKPGSPMDASALTYTRDYLLHFEQALDKSSNSAELIAAMKKAYPEAGLGIALEIGAKVNTGEMEW